MAVLVGFVVEKWHWDWFFLQIIHFPLSVPVLLMLRRALGPLNFAVPRDVISLLPKSIKHNTGKKSTDSNDNEIKLENF